MTVLVISTITSPHIAPFCNFFKVDNLIFIANQLIKAIFIGCFDGTNGFKFDKIDYFEGVWTSKLNYQALFTLRNHDYFYA